MHYDPYSPPAYPAPPPAPAALTRPSFPKAAYLVPIGIAAGLDYIGRITAAQGAVHSVGDALLPGAIALGTGVIGGILAFAKHSLPLITGMCLLVSAGATDFAVAAYSARWGLPAGVAAMAALAGGGAMTQVAQFFEARAERREVRQHERAMQQDRLAANHHVELVHAEGAEVRAHYAEQHAELANRAASAALELVATTARAVSQRSDYSMDLGHLTPEARAFVYAQLRRSLGPSIAEPSISEPAIERSPVYQVEQAWTA